MNRNKICPDCETEYQPTIERCADCGTVLLLHEEHERARQEKERLAQKAVEDAVTVREGDLKWMEELHKVLIASGIPCRVAAEGSCRPGRCGDKYVLLASSADLERAQARVEEYYMEVYPEMRASSELASQGKCPACGYSVRESDAQCPDCGLPFIIIEEAE